MFKVPLATSSTSLTAATFWESVLVYHNRAHLVNRKLIAVSQVAFHKTSVDSKAVVDLTSSSILYEVRKLKKVAKEYISENFITNILESCDKNIHLTETAVDDFNTEDSGVFLSVRILIPRNQKCEKCIEIVILDKDKDSAIFLAAMEIKQITLAPPFPYEIELTANSNLRINLKTFEDADTTHAEWIADKLFPKLLSWAENSDTKGSINSLSMIPVDEYSSIYGSLKNKYGADLLKEWPKKTNTNPQKYIFEDIAIASYLISLWKKYARDEVNFVDCGCGNGLLVYILTQEGYKGYGIDIRQRPVWDIYPPETQLKVATITPSSVFHESTWIIGNHSDELTPWIPVMALRSSPRTNFFVLPCCPYDFNGQKYVRTNTSLSQYSDYFDYIQNICKMCGFDTKVDKLRIPSTKRTCLIGIRQQTSDTEYIKTNSEINTYIDTRLSSGGFKPRCEIEKVRNCTQLDKVLIQKIVFSCINSLLVKENYIKKSNGENWNKGTCLSLLELSRVISKENLKQLKKECGGLQTLLKNHRYLFELKDGKVHIREPLRSSEVTKKYKDKPCWFLKHHPNGCLYDSNECAYQH